MRKLLKVILPVFLFFVMNCSAYADNSSGLRVGVINVQQIMQKSPMVIALNDKLKAQFQPRQTELVNAQNNLQAEVDKLNKNGAVMSNADRSQLQDKIISDRANLQGMGQSFQQDLTAAQNQSMQQFMGKLQTAVNVVAADGKYDLILQRSGTPYVSSALDITTQVMDQLAKS